MSERSVTHSTFVLERTYPASPERVFAALADPKKKRRWFVDGEGHEVEHYELDFRVGGIERVRFRLGEGTPLKGVACSSHTIYQDIVLNQRIVFASTMSIAGNCISASLATFELLPSSAVTELIFTHQGAFFAGADGAEMRQMGWRQLLERLTDEFTR